MEPVKVYLLFYNFAQVAGWSVILVKTLLALMESKDYKGIYDAVADELNVFQTAAFLEVVHSALGFVRSPIMMTFMQVLSRLMITWPVVYAIPSVQHGIGIPLFLIAWSVTEVIRYSFYGLTIIHSVPYCLLWLRYSLFIVLYPIGVTGELLSIYAALPVIKQNNIFSIELPNSANISFSFYYALILFAISYIPFFPQLYCYMLGQRKKLLGNEAQKKRD